MLATNAPAQIILMNLDTNGPRGVSQRDESRQIESEGCGKQEKQWQLLCLRCEYGQRECGQELESEDNAE